MTETHAPPVLCPTEALIARLEAATGPDRDLDVDIALAVQAWPEDVFPMRAMPGQIGLSAYRSMTAPHYTAILDAALMLVPDGWYGFVEPFFHEDGEFVRYRGHCARPDWAKWNPDGSWIEKVETAQQHPTPALALCIAALRARATGGQA